VPIGDASVDAVICECAFCTFPDKSAAAEEFARILLPPVRVGLSDVTHERRAARRPAVGDGEGRWLAAVRRVSARGLNRVDVAGVDFETARRLARQAMNASASGASAMPS